MKPQTLIVILVALSSILFTSLAQIPAPPAATGKAVFEQKCTRCHGHDGTKGVLGAKNLRTSNLGDTDLITIISNGRRIMPSWKKRLTQEEIRLVARYVKNLRP